MTTRKISPAEYDAFRSFLENACGIVLGDNKQYLITSRLNRLMNEKGIETFDQLIRMLGRDSALRNRILDAMTTNETSWFRDKYPFEIMKSTILPEVSTRRESQLRIWSAASSSGQEAYSISMTIQEYLKARSGNLPSTIEIIGTDISASVLSEAEKGQYDAMTMVRGLTQERRDQFFSKVSNADAWEVKDDIRRRVKFRELNLLNSYSSLGKFDVIFCRYVLIYFSADMKREILAKMAASLKPSGYLFLGGSESTANYTDAFEMIRAQTGVVYRLRP